MKRIMMPMAVLSIVLSVNGKTEFANGYTWTYRIKGGKAEIFSYVDSDRYSDFPAISPLPTGAVTVPSTLGGKPVTRIGPSAFLNCSGLTSVIIPASVKSIGEGAFDGCDSLRSLVLPTWCKTATAYLSDSGWVFAENSVGNYSLGYHFNYCCCQSFGYDNERDNARACAEDFMRRVKITYKDVWDSGSSGGGSGGGSVADVWKKARTLQAVLMDDYSGDVEGVIQVKVGKANKNGQVSISGTITGLDGKKQTAKGVKVTVSGSSVSVVLAVKDGGTAWVTIDESGVSGSYAGCQIVRTTIGGKFWKTAMFNVKGTTGEPKEGEYVAAWPNHEPVEMRGAKWVCEKAGKMKWLTSCCHNGWCVICGDVECCGWKQVGDTNVTGLRLSYAANTGVFKGSFNLYLDVYDSRHYNDKGVKKTVSVRGIVVDGIGYGMATLRGYGSWPVTIR